MRPFVVASASVLSLLLISSPLFAQPPWTAEVRGGVESFTTLSYFAIDVGIALKF